MTPNADLDPIDDLLDVLDLTWQGSTTIGAVSPAGMSLDLGTSEGDIFKGRSQPQPHGRVYGGQVLAQAVVAAGRTVPEDEDSRPIHSLHAYFLRPGDDKKPIEFVVERMRDGASFSARRVHALQEGRILLSLSASFQRLSDGMEHDLPMPAAPAPEQLRPDREVLAQIDHPIAQHRAENQAVELRHVEPLLLAPSPPGADSQSVWMKLDRELPEDDLLHAAVLAYASDYVLLEPILRRHGVAWGDPRMRMASLDHVMWFHRPVRVDQWLLYTQSSPSARSGRGLGLGHMFTQDGTLLATVGQEGMVRIKE